MKTSKLLPTEYASRFDRLIVGAGILCALLIIAATIAHNLQLREEISREAQGQLKTVTQILTQEVNRSLMRTRGLLEQVDEVSTSWMTLSPADNSARLEAMTRQHFLLREVALVDSKGLIDNQKLVAAFHPMHKVVRMLLMR